ncbi:MAG: hypothetical protein GY778_14730 [bacterium]|nr:hypothetical protein [bacterium]
MNLPICRAGAGALLLVVVFLGGQPASGQTNTPPEVIVDLNEGIAEYMRGQPDSPEHWRDAIERLDRVIEAAPENQPARLFRALSLGRLALYERRQASRFEINSYIYDTILGILENEDRLEEVLAEKAELEEALKNDALSDWQRLLFQKKLDDDIGLLLFNLERHEGKTAEQVRELKKEAERNVRRGRTQERSYYDRMLVDVRALVQTLDSPEAVLGLREVIARTKVAGIDERTAYQDVLADAAADEQGRTPAQRRESAKENLEAAADLLVALLDTDLAETDAIRSRFFLGVIRFRQALPRRAPSEQVAPNTLRLKQAKTRMAELIADERTSRQWRSYAELYLGLIETELATQEPDPADKRVGFEVARGHLDSAAQYNTVIKDGKAASDSDETLALVWKQREEIEQREQAKEPPQYWNDLQLSVQMGVHRDTNVVLLGGRTDLPRGITDEEDFGFTLNTVLDYTLDLGRFDRRLDRWTVGLQGRVGQLWHVEVDEFDEQNYGGSAAVQYELLERTKDFGPVFLSLQYDYDYTLLGRDPFLEASVLTPTLRIFAKERRAVTDLSFSYSIRDYREPLYDRRFNRDGEYYRLGVVQSFKAVDLAPVYEGWNLPVWGLPADEEFAQDDPDFPKRYLLPFIGFAYGWDSTDGDEFDQKAYILTCGAEVPLPYGMTLDTVAEFEWQEYAHGSLIDFHRRGRRDFVQRYSIGLWRTFVLQSGDLVNRYTMEMDRVLMTLRAHATWTLDDSNVVDRLGQAIFEYDRVVYGLSVAFTFN